MLRLLPKGTHEWRKFIRPSEMSDHLRHASLDIRDLTGMTYNPITKTYRLGRDVDVNYMMHAMDTREDSTPS
jgi:2-polyprenyl-6-hydroxyphenyl methylase/3-demethylubiquinone-9 3-methyltransferase